jgi:hypothetical protein
VTVALRAILVLPLVGALLTACSGPTRLGECPKLSQWESGKLTKQDNDSENLRCEWQAAGGVSVRVRMWQPVRYDEGQGRANSTIEKSWREDDRIHVTRRVEGLGDGGYRFTAVVDDVVQVTVKGFHGFREMTLEVSQKYASAESTAALEAASEKAGIFLLEAS